MIRRFTLVGALVLSAVLAFVLRKFIYEMVIIPLAYLWWVIGLYYRLVPQVFVWIVLIFVILFTGVRALLMEIPVQRQTKPNRKSSAGPIETLSALVQKQNRGIYYKWLIANRLGKVAREILDQREGQRLAQRFTRLAGRDWNPPNEVGAYLESGLNGSFADYPPSRWLRAQPTPLDEQPGAVVDYLESEMEIH